MPRVSASPLFYGRAVQYLLQMVAPAEQDTFKDVWLKETVASEIVRVTILASIFLAMLAAYSFMVIFFRGVATGFFGRDFLAPMIVMASAAAYELAFRFALPVLSRSHRRPPPIGRYINA